MNDTGRLLEPQYDVSQHGAVPFNEVDTNLTRADCERIIALSNSIPARSGKVQRRGGDLQHKVVNIRDVTVYPVDDLDDDATRMWLESKVVDIAAEANGAFNYDLTGLIESLQLLKYQSPSKGYDWHHDLGNGKLSCRKISVSVFLNDDYEGGEFIMFDKGEVKITSRKRTAVAFSSFIPHKVTPIVSGTRWSLVGWISGPAFK